MKLKEKIERIRVYFALDLNESVVLYNKEVPPKGDHIKVRQSIVIYPTDDVVVCTDEDYNFRVIELSKAFRRLEEAWEEREETEDIQEIWCESLLGADFNNTWDPRRFSRFKSFEEYKDWWLKSLTNDPWGIHSVGVIFNLSTGEVKDGNLKIREWKFER